MRNLARTVLALALATGFISIASAGSIANGDLLVIDQMAGAANHGVLFVVNPGTGARTQFSEFGNSNQGATGVDPNSVGWMPPAVLGLLGPSALLVTDGSAGTDGRGALFKVDPNTGSRVLLSDFGNSIQGPIGLYPTDVLVIRPGLLNWSGVLVVDPFAGTNGQGAIFSVGLSGTRTLVTDFGVGTNQGQYPNSMAYCPGLLGLGSTVLVADASAGTNSLGMLFTVNPATGTRTVLSDFGNRNQGWVDSNPLSGPLGVTVSPLGQIFVLVQDFGPGGGGAIVQVDPASGKRTLISNLSDQTQGPAATVPNRIGWLPSRGALGVTDANGGTGHNGTLLVVDPASGQRQVLSDFGNSDQGSLGSVPSGLTVIQ